MSYKHIPVMLKEVIEHLKPKKGEYFIDCTLGGGGYTREIAKAVSEEGRVLAIDMDPLAIKNTEARLKELKINNVILANDNFKNLPEIIKRYFKKEGPDNRFSGVVLDLGLSSAQLEDRSRGFSFKLAESLDMAFGSAAEISTEEIVNNWKERDLEKIIREYGEEKFSRRIAGAIAEARKIEKIRTAVKLAEIIEKAVPGKYASGKIHPATRTFQALRIATNDELNNLSQVLPVAVELLKEGGRIAVVSFHSLEDRIIKNFFRQESRGCICPPALPECRCGHTAKLKIITKKIIEAGEPEIISNPRSRSAKLRVAEKI